MAGFSQWLSQNVTAWSAGVWDGFVRAVDARFKPLEEQLDIQRETTDKIVARGLTVIEDELAPVVSQGASVLGEINDIKGEAQGVLDDLESKQDLGIPINDVVDLPTRLGAVETHAGQTDNPHAVTKAQVGLSNVDNTSDAEKPISTATSNALAGKLAADGSTPMAGNLDLGGHAILNQSNVIAGYRSKIINGNFAFWQRGTSLSSGGYLADRWNVLENGSNTLTQSRQSFALGQTDVPGEPRYFMRVDVTAADPSSSSYIACIQKIEDVRTLAAKQATCSFYAKADASREIAVEFRQYFGTGGSPSGFVTSHTEKVSLTTAWQRFDITDTLASIAGKTLGSNGNHALWVVFWLSAGSDSDAQSDTLGTQVGTFDFARVSLVEGDATMEDDPFEPRHPQQELALCQRYYQKLVGYKWRSRHNNTIADGQNCGEQTFVLPAPMRDDPSASITVTESQNTKNHTFLNASFELITLECDGTGGANINGYTADVVLDAEL